MVEDKNDQAIEVNLNLNLDGLKRENSASGNKIRSTKHALDIQTYNHKYFTL